MMRVLLRVLLGLVAAGAAGCGSDATRCDDGEVKGPDGGCMAAPPPYCQPCSGKVASEIPPVDCSSQGCGGNVAYAVCDGTCWKSCACSLPRGFKVVDAGFFGPEGGSDGD